VDTQHIIDQGGYIYPLVSLDEKNTPHVELGMTRRDWLAGLAMQGLTGTGSGDSGKDNMHPTTALEISRTAYHLADIMIRVGHEDETSYRLPHEVATETTR